jgi:hypothetical protein
VDLIDAENGTHRRLDTDSRTVRESYEAERQARTENLTRLFSTNGIDHVPIIVGTDYARPLARLFINRERRM